MSYGLFNFRKNYQGKKKSISYYEIVCLRFLQILHYTFSYLYIKVFLFYNLFRMISNKISKKGNFNIKKNEIVYPVLIN